MARRLRHKRMISFYAWFNKIRTPGFKEVATIKGSSIITNDALFISQVTSICDMKLENKPVYDSTKLKYNIYDINNKHLAYVDNAFNVFSPDYKYVGTIYNQFKFIYLFILMALILMMILALGIYGVKQTGPSIKTMDIEINEKDGNLVVQECDLFIRYNGNKLIAPGRYESYYFTVSNNNPKNISVRFTLDEDNNADIPMMYRVISNGSYVSGDVLTFVEIEDVEYIFDLKAGETKEFRLDWNWLDYDDEFDTNLGIKATDTYTIYLIFEVTE